MMDRQRLKAVLSALILSTVLPIVDVCTDLYTSISLYTEGKDDYSHFLGELVKGRQILAAQTVFLLEVKVKRCSGLHLL
jgi:hypothetical protein